jgi:proteasome lid subunit RPN8/RPN11
VFIYIKVTALIELFMKVIIEDELLGSLLAFARMKHPREGIILLRGNMGQGEISIKEFLLPPFATSGRGFASFPLHMLPIDFSIVGTAHSHPSGSLRPSTNDLNRFYGRIMVIVAFPYTLSQVAVYNSKGEKLSLIIES